MHLCESLQAEQWGPRKLRISVKNTRVRWNMYRSDIADGLDNLDHDSRD